MSLSLVFFLILQTIAFLGQKLKVDELRFLGLMINVKLRNEEGNVHFEDLDVRLL